ncbi:FAD:protein FMN transferase [Rubripirellula reticaptiva]|uniref:FAD:protein FMN transferase n=1 Tax=Rubripirellula reticaptiva TaxID=2528013 RepID=A0A5C6F5N5_9BACT|nr:FAD:protein FMN transferase [Rubripirellula reticaptiva]TWU55159.1 Thiamine biosynthesis lipoprotein ApbE precursor [Rubripirellula reticaptiva]
MTRFRGLLILAFVGLLACNPCLSGGAAAADGELLEFFGETMGTTYSVKVFQPPESLRVDNLRIDVDGVLRNVNDQMSTYLKSSEISQFNESNSTDWFAVSPEFASVVETALEVSVKTDGAFDVTVGPLVNAWNFGVGPRTSVAPSAETIAKIQDSIGYQKLAVRMDPPAIRKSVPSLKIDLSAIAKGHGVDRVVKFLNEQGLLNIFVEIGGEVRVSGSKSGKPWKVGIQMPDATTNQWTIAHAFGTGGTDHAMATSGDYRNFFEADGKRYSHTIDPRTGYPVDHALASVSILADRCVDADAWATAINAMGPAEGLAIAQTEDLDALLISRSSDGFTKSGTGELAQYVATNTTGEKMETTLSANGSPWVIVAITTIAFATILFSMAIGVIFGRKAISGSCGGIANKTNPDGSTSCGLCSNPADACKELRDRMQNQTGENA